MPVLVKMTSLELPKVHLGFLGDENAREGADFVGG